MCVNRRSRPRVLTHRQPRFRRRFQLVLLFSIVAPGREYHPSAERVLNFQSPSSPRKSLELISRIHWRFRKPNHKGQSPHFGRVLAARLNGLRKKSVLHLILGGAAVYRCDNPPTFSTGFSRRGKAVSQEALFPQALKPCPSAKPIFETSSSPSVPHHVGILARNVDA